MKKLLLFSLLIISCNAMEFDPAIQKALNQGVKKIVTIGTQMENHQQNGIVTIYKNMSEEIEKTGGISLSDEGKKMAQELNQEVINNRDYQTALEDALEKTAAMVSAWNDFRKIGANILTDNLELTTSMHFNRNPCNLEEFLKLNQNLNPLIDTQDVRVALLLLYSFQQTQLTSIEEQLPWKK